MTTVLSFDKRSVEYREFLKCLSFYHLGETYLDHHLPIYVHTKTDKYYRVKMCNYDGDFVSETRGDIDFVDFLEVKPVEQKVTIIDWINA